MHSDHPEGRLLARFERAAELLDQKQPAQALQVVSEYTQPLDENFAWPFVLGYLSGVVALAEQEQMFDAVKRLELAKNKTDGLGAVVVLRTFSEVVELQPDLLKALSYEKKALVTGKQWFRRQKISDSAGWAPEKEGMGAWKKLKPLIEARIRELERWVDIDRYGLDYVLFREAQKLRNAGHPSALDFTDIDAAFRIRGEDIRTTIPGADFLAARKQYLEIIQLFPEGMYTEASKLYAAVCLVHLGDAQGAIRELTAFYKLDPNGLYRGKALQLLGDLYLVNQWDRVNAKEAYTRASEWASVMKTRKRVVETYAVPEKSRQVAMPPERIRTMNEDGEIKERPIQNGVLVNRATAKWYLPRIKADVEWKLGFLAVVEDRTEDAKRHFDLALDQDRLLQRAVGQKVFNAYDRLILSAENRAFFGEQEELKKLHGNVKLAMQWADFQFMRENFDVAKSLYRLIQFAASVEEDDAAFVRAVVGEAVLLYRKQGEPRPQDVPSLYDHAVEFPQAPATPYLLWHCAMMTDGTPMGWREFYDLLIRKYPQSRHGLEARYNLIIRLPWGQHEERREMINTFQQDYPQETGYHKYLEGWDKNVTEYHQRKEETRSIQSQEDNSVP